MVSEDPGGKLSLYSSGAAQGPKHKAKPAHWFHQNKVEVLERPSPSPDLSVIELLWGDLKQAVQARQSEN